MSRSRIAAAAFVIAAGTASAAQAPPIVRTPVQTIELYSYGYNPDPIILTAGRPVLLNFVNRAGKSHDFTAPKFFNAARIVGRNGVVVDGEVDLRGRRSASVTLVPAAGRYKVHCGKPFHKVMGMRGDIIVR